MLEDILQRVGEERRETLFHVLHCSYCQSRFHYLPRTAELAEEEGGEYEAAFQAGLAMIESRAPLFEKERAEAPALMVDLMEQQAEHWEDVLRQLPRFHTWGLLDLLIERSRETSVRDPSYSEELGRLAIILSESLEPARYGDKLIEDLRARAWAFIGNARRTKSDLQGAEDAFVQATRHLMLGTGDRLEQGILIDLVASLRRDQRRFNEAEDLLEEAVTTFLQVGDRHRAGRSLVNLSTVLNYAGETADCIPALQRALDLIDPEHEPRLLLCAVHNLGFVLADLGRFQEAWTLYRQNRQLYRDFAEPWVQNRRKWVRGKIVRGLGHAEHAEKLFLSARDGFVAEGVPYDTALVSLELATLYAEQGRTAELKRLAEEMVPIFASRQIHREALAALAFFRQAVEAEAASVEVVGRVAAFLKRAQNDPAMRFEDG
jgi:tetratricopeptide (TPR) repeat protein